MALPTNATRLRDIHPTLHSERVNVKAFDAVGDGVADDKASIQAAIDVAMGAGHGRVYFPAGTYKINSTLSITGASPIRLTGEHARHGEDAYNPASGSTGIFGTINGPLIERTNVGENEVTIENLAFRNQHAAGKALSLAAMRSPCSVRDCAFHAFIGLEIGANVFELQVQSCQFRPEGGGTPIGSRGITGLTHGDIIGCDFNGFERAINLASAPNANIFGARIEVCDYGIYSDTCGGVYEGIYFEACDIGIEGGAFVGTISGCVFHGTTGSPSGGSTNGIRISGGSGVVVGCRESGGHSGTFITCWNGPMTFIGCHSTTAWGITPDGMTQVINCSPVTNVALAPVIATGSLPAAGAGQNGRIVIEDNGAGDRNLILYAGGQRFRIDGGAAI